MFPRDWHSVVPSDRPMTDCILQKLDEGSWQCLACDPDGKRLLPVKAHRNCTKTTPREGILDELWQLSELSDNVIDTEERLSNCETCLKFTGNGCERYTGCSGRRRWLNKLINNPECEYKQNIQDTQLDQSLFARMKRFNEAQKKWRKYGKIYRTKERIIEIFDTICSVCEFFDKNQCRVCGCRIVREGMLINKLAWASEKCPKGKFLEEEEVLRKIKEDDAKEKHTQKKEKQPKNDCRS